MIRSVGRAGPIKVAARVLWQLKYNLLAVLVVALILIPIPDTPELLRRP
ncbi:hypothetical protein ORI20_04250 [Mycobacterium sp. CVI_P3]|uniref:Uncharacterized protein n=1 Tax=Mycobacterium pinniadriaticum TaxID=2994102 RepID=A0ABT3S8S7_9MYCO|nr:hypothetical protein [Mycobacterium pinniadriaticum]MCX2929472.1 hypothetical protein [Mycobacterium pinniadriaticum]MCX2935896.1 hypothetical protein [Mycobacterium pinniadriaticum]